MQGCVWAVGVRRRPKVAACYSGHKRTYRAALGPAGESRGAFFVARGTSGRLSGCLAERSGASPPLRLVFVRRGRSTTLWSRKIYPAGESRAGLFLVMGSVANADSWPAPHSIIAIPIGSARPPVADRSGLDVLRGSDIVRGGRRGARMRQYASQEQPAQEAAGGSRDDSPRIVRARGA